MNNVSPFGDVAALVELQETLVGWQLHNASGCTRWFPEFEAIANTFQGGLCRVAMAIVEMRRTDMIVSPKLVWPRLAPDQGLADIGGAEYLVNIADAAPVVLDERDGLRQAKSAIATHRELTFRLQARATAQAVVDGDLDPIAATSELQAALAALGPRNVLDRHVPIVTSASFVKAFIPPNYIVDGILQRGFFYSLTAPTGSGKTAIMLLLLSSVARGCPFAGRETERGRVLMLAAENADDVRARWIALAEAELFDANAIDVDFMPGGFRLSDNLERINAQAATVGGYAFIGVDTSAAFFEGDNENDNTQHGEHARLLRTLTQVDGNPCVLANCHPVKNAREDSLIPRGGGAFLNEVDGNLCLWKDDDIVRLHWQGKFRGPEFAQIAFELREYRTQKLTNRKGQLMPTVVANWLPDSAAAAKTDETRENLRTLLSTMAANPGASVSQLARQADWMSSTGEPLKSRVDRTMKLLKRDGLVKQEMKTWRLTEEGARVAKGAKT